MVSRSMTQSIYAFPIVLFMALACVQPGPEPTPTPAPTPTKQFPDPVFFQLAWDIVEHQRRSITWSSEKLSDEVWRAYQILEAKMAQPIDPFLFGASWDIVEHQRRSIAWPTEELVEELSIAYETLGNSVRGSPE